MSGADPAAVILGMDIRPLDAVGRLTITRTNPTSGLSPFTIASRLRNRANPPLAYASGDCAQYSDQCRVPTDGANLAALEDTALTITAADFGFND